MIVWVDYPARKDCQNEDSLKCVCLKCGACGRRFSSFGLLVEPPKETPIAQPAKDRPPRPGGEGDIRGRHPTVNMLDPAHHGGRPPRLPLYHLVL
jgi:hypothetical protein